MVNRRVCVKRWRNAGHLLAIVGPLELSPGIN